MATIDEIKQQAEAVKNATQVGENTAERVGGALAGLAEIAEQHDTELGKKANKMYMDVELGKKVDKEEGKSLIEDEVKKCFRVIENEEFIYAVIDSAMSGSGSAIFGIFKHKPANIEEQFEGMFCKIMKL